VYDDEPHKTRRTEILKKYPEIKKLFGYDSNFKFKCIALVILQIASLYFLKDKSWSFLIVMAYCFGGVINHSLSLAVHEISHNLAFGHSRYVLSYLVIHFKYKMIR
jgi:sphingolipid 4-desaturase/C4-monooxygenase